MNNAMMNLMVPRVLRFVVVAEQLSFTKAAQVLGQDQPALSRQIMQLEDQIGFTLFHRNGARIALTSEGKEFYRAAKIMADATDQLGRTAETMALRSKSIVRLGVTYTTFSVDARTELLQRYSALRPNDKVDISAFEWTDEVAAAVVAGTVDIGLCFGPITHSGLDVCVLSEIDMTLAIPSEDPLAACPEISLSDLSGRRIAVGLMATSAQARSHPYQWIEEVGAQIVRVPEGRRYLFDVAERERLITPCYTSSDRIPESFVRCRVVGRKPTIDMSLIRCRRVMSASAERLWRLGQQLSAQNMPLPT
jgi:DNA-binding transcriptional LysR family regulator